MTQQIRDKFFIIRMTLDEFEKLKTLATQHNLTRSELVRKIIKEMGLKPRPLGRL